MRTFRFLRLLVLWLVPLSGVAQSPNWTRITDPTNPINTYTARGPYRGAAWVDANNDGRLDLFVVPNALFLNTGGGHFTQAATPTIAPVPRQNMGGCSWADLDNDGDLDLVLAQFPSGIYRNDGGQFTDITSQFPGLTNYAAWACAIADVNRDQRLDVLLVHAAGFHPSAMRQTCRFYLQDTGGAFQPVSGYAFTDSLAPYTVPYFADYDQDGDQDLFIAAGPAGTAGRDFCYRNLKVETGHDTLARMTTETFAAQRQDGQGYGFVDVDHDGDYDLCLTNYQAMPTRFFLNQNGTYVAATTPFTRNQPFHLGSTWGDFDLDGDPDVFITSDTDSVRYYRNDGGTFVAERAFQDPAGSSGLVAGDYDDDGDLDVFVNGRSVAPVAYGLFRNEAATRTGRHWVNLHLLGVQSNRTALGARVRLWTTVQGQAAFVQTREVSAQNTFQGQNDLRVHFGLDQATTIDSLEIWWPAGLHQRITGLAADHFYAITEGQNPNILTATPPLRDEPRPYTLAPNPVSDLVHLVLQPSLGPVMAQVFDAVGRLLWQQQLAAGSQVVLATQAWPAGSYTFTLTAAGRVWHERLLRP